MQHDCVELLLQTVLSPSSLKHLILVGVDSTASSFERLKENRNITVLEFPFVPTDSKTISSIAEVLHSNTALEELRFHLSNDRDPRVNDELIDLSRALKVNRSLKVLRIGCSGSLTLGPLREGALALIGALQCNQTLKQLYLPRLLLSLGAMDSRIVYTFFDIDILWLHK